METSQNLWRINSKARCSVRVIVLRSRVSLQMTTRCFWHHMPGRRGGCLSPFCTQPLHWLASPSLASFCPKEVFESLSCALCSSQQLLPILPTTSWTQRTPGASHLQGKKRGPQPHLKSEGPGGDVHSDTDPGSIELKRKLRHTKGYR